MKHWKATLASGAITLAAVTVAANAVINILDRLPNTSVADDSVSMSAIPSQLEGKSEVISNEQNLIAARCRKIDHQAFKQLKKEGIENRVALEYEAAADAFEDAFELCAAPEVKIAFNNAAIGSKLARSVVVSVPFSGKNPNNAVEMLRGFAQAQTEINEAGGINGVPLKLIVVDDADSEQNARQLARLLTNDPQYTEVLGIIGHWTSDVSLTAAAIYHQSKSLPFITPISTTKELTGYSPWVYRATINNRSGTRAMAEYMLNEWDLRKAVIFYVGGVTYSEEIRKEFRDTLEAADGEIIEEFDMSEDDFAARWTVEEAITQGAEVILLATDNASVPIAHKVMTANKGRMKMLGDVANLYSTETLMLQEAAEGLVMALSWDVDGDVNERYVEGADSLWGAEVNHVSASSYSALKAMSAAIEVSPTRSGVQRALADESFAVQGASKTPLTFDRGDRQAPPQLIQIVSNPFNFNPDYSIDFKPVQ